LTGDSWLHLIQKSLIIDQDHGEVQQEGGQPLPQTVKDEPGVNSRQGMSGKEENKSLISVDYTSHSTP
jgi:hypothetical protein